MLIKTKRGARRTRNQRVIDRRFVVTDYEGCSYITAGKLYKTFNGKKWSCNQIYNNDKIACLIYQRGNCPHLDDMGTWYHPIR